jgi:hypothetical protein
MGEGWPEAARPGGYGAAGILRRASPNSWSLVREEGGPEAAAHAATEPAGILRRVQPESRSLGSQGGWPGAALRRLRSSRYPATYHSELRSLVLGKSRPEVVAQAMSGEHSATSRPGSWSLAREEGGQRQHAQAATEPADPGLCCVPARIADLETA